MAGINPLEMSDEDIMNMSAPPAPEGAPAPETPAPTAEVVAEEPAPAPEGNVVEETGKEPAEAAPGQEAAPEGDKPAEEQNPEGGAVPKTGEEPAKAAEPEGAKPEGTVPATGSGEAKTRTAEDHAAFYDAVMKPFTANGKEIKLNSPEEVIQLMQQGANYTRKMQAIAPHRKVLTMLENNGLLSEDKLSFLIDLEKGNPDAVQKLLKDKGIDAMSIDTESESTYREGNHRVSDNEVSFRTNIDELSSTQEGTATLQLINTTWDDASKEVLWADPSVMPVIHTQKQNGIYDRISSEVDRRKLLGQISPETPFIDAYRTVGDDLFKSGGLADLAPKPQVKTDPVVTTTVPKVPVATTAAAPKPVVENGDKAGAASPTRAAPKTAKPFVNPLAMSDAEFDAQFKSMQGRV